MKILDLETIREKTDIPLAYESLRQGFIAHSQNKMVSSISQLSIDQGSLHVKSGYMKGDSHFFIKLATGFSENWRQGLPTGDGCILGFTADTGTLDAILLDQGYLTDLRTALAARLCIERFCPPIVNSVGILGTGTQARFCTRQQAHATQCHNIYVWGRKQERIDDFKGDLETEAFQVTVVNTPNELLENCEIVIATTSSRKPLLDNILKRKAKLIVAVGADEIGKQELDPHLVATAQILVADDSSQSIEIGEFQNANRLNLIEPESIQELGNVLLQNQFCTENFVICDLSGLPVQDTQMAETVLEKI